MTRLNVLFILAVVLAGAAFPQIPRAEIGVQLSGQRESAMFEYPLSGGGRVTMHAFRMADAEVGVDRYPIGGRVALFPATQLTLGTLCRSPIRASRHL